VNFHGIDSQLGNNLNACLHENSSQTTFNSCTSRGQVERSRRVRSSEVETW